MTADDGRPLIHAGDVYWVDFDPTKGSEQAGARPALVISDVAYNRRSDLVIVCPITRNTRPWPTKIVMVDEPDIEGAVLVDQVRSLHRASRGFRFAGRVSPELLSAVRAKLFEIIGPGSKDAD
ncbi:type II toxin-antitoxin system PemK/MazF family toxin [Phreatobacter oligotrophus]|uniref:type II toxin-antitoxin system PemK/MazF family toxin n=1 Tax=Phreatobacter oligotrophus TaxID=1122261 RepID=UPI002355F8D6|nr:type II toxin-antitoxin system PemK/MazF family toxin [Phreatobacter oligotrophus]MBX9989337.1 type II toxin-antitoxin system PemK/MazF family toxin [Phreatobacter oligotrophus]